MRKTPRDTDEKESSKPLPEVFPAKRGRPVGSGRKKVHRNTCIALQIPGMPSKHSQLLAKANRCMHAQIGALAAAAQAGTSKKASNGKAKSAVADPEPSEASIKPRRKRYKKVKSSHKHLRQFLPSVSADGETFHVGDSAYLIMTEDFDEDDFAAEEFCQVCGSAEQVDVPILECNKCLLGYHLNCLRPPLAEVPKVSE